MRQQRLFWQIFPVSLLITMGAILAVSWFATSSLRTFYFSRMEVDIEARALLLEQKIVDLSAVPLPALQDFCRQAGRRAATRITVVTADGLVLADSNEDPKQMENHGNRPELIRAFKGNTGSALRYSHTLGQEMLYVAIPIQLNVNGSQVQGGLRLSVPVTALNTVLASIGRRILAGSLLVIVLAALLSLYLARRISRPLEEIRQGAARLARGEIDQFVNVRQRGMSIEMNDLVRSLNQMANQINERIHIIRRQRNELEAVFSSMTEAVVAIDADECVIRVNRAASVLLNIDGETVQGSQVQGLLRNPELLGMIRSCQLNNSCSEAEIEWFDGREHSTVQVRTVPLQDSEQQPIGALVVMGDMTRLNQLENLRRDFVANVSHELKTPITAIRGYVETLIDTAMDDRENSRRFLEIVTRQACRLDAIVDDLLTLSRIEERLGSNTVELRVQEIKPVLAGALQTCSLAAADKNVTVILHCPSSLQAKSNPQLLEQAVVNLLNNAITHSFAGSTVEVRADVDPGSRGRQGGQVRIRVVDQGKGIGAEHLERIFERFYRCDKARSRQNGGTGLGLAIVKHIAHSHGGSVEVSSQLNRGSVFTLYLQSQ